MWSWIRWFGHALGWSRNPLRRSVDRGAAALTAALIGLVLLAVPVAASWGSTTYQRELAIAGQEAVSKHEVQAIVTGPIEHRVSTSEGPHAAQVLQTWGVVSWFAGDGTPRTEQIQVGSTKDVGERITLWVDDGDRIAAAPRTADQVMASAWMYGAGSWLAMATGCAALAVLVNHVARGIACRNWQREWEVVEPTWAHRQK